MQAVLQIRQGRLKGESRVIHRRHITLGRDLSCVLWMPDESLLPRHAELFLHEGKWFVRALAPEAAITVNGQTVAESVLSDGDTLTLGEVSLQWNLRKRRIPLGIAMALFLLAGGLVALIRTCGNTPGTPEVPAPSTAPLAVATNRESTELTTMELLSQRLESTVSSNPVVKIETPHGNIRAAGSDLLDGADAAISSDPAVIGPTLGIVRGLIEKGHTDEALKKLDALQKVHTTSLQLWIEHARIHEKLGRYADAEIGWKMVLRLSGEGPLYDQAAMELSRLAQLEMGTAPPETKFAPVELPDAPPPLPDIPVLADTLSLEPPPTPPDLPVVTVPTNGISRAQVTLPAPSPPKPARVATTAPAAVAPKPAESPVKKAAQLPSMRLKPLVMIQSGKISRFPSGPAEDMRILTVTLSRPPESRWIRMELITVEAQFFDCTDNSDRPFPTRALTGSSPTHLPPQSFSNGGDATVTFSYTVLAGQRERDRAKGYSPAHFFGYRIRLYYDGQLQDELSKPDFL